MKLVKQKRISPRKMWPHEAADFTPWLSENLNELGEKMGMELELVDKEVSVGPYSADILAKDAENGSFVVIENQLEKTNHDHLGKSITYASALNAKTIVWVTTDFTDEHKKALDWLNDNTNGDISFWGFQLELWQITEQTASVRFNIISSPSSDVKQIKKNSRDLTDASRTQLMFWTKFREKLQATGKIKSNQKAAPQYWYDVTLGKAGLHLSNTCNTMKNIVSVRVYINNQIADTVFPYLLSRKEEINKMLGCLPVWDHNPNATDKTIILSYNTDLTKPQKVDEAISWMVEKTLIFKEVFSSIIKEMK